MKKNHQSEKFLLHGEYRSRKNKKRRIERRRIIKAKRRSFIGKPSKIVSDIKKKETFNNYVKAPSNFCFLENQDEVIEFLYKLETSLQQNMRTFVVLKDIQSIDYGAITVLLSTMIKFQVKRVGFSGDFPKKIELHKLLMESGFFDSLNETKRSQGSYVLGKDNQFITHGNKKVVAALGLPIMEAVSSTIWGEKRIDKGLQRALLELMQNTNNHASFDETGKKYWWLSVNHDKENKKVRFVFMDHGVGIFASLNQKSEDSKWYGWSEKIKSAFGVETDEKILERLLKGDLHLTVTKKSYRGKGLPSMKEVLDRNQINNLHIITNNVFADVSNNNYHLLKHVFKGTFFYWEICENNSNQTWTI